MKHFISFVIIHLFFTVAMFSLANEKINLKSLRTYFAYFFTLLLLLINYELSMTAMRVILNFFIYILLARLLFQKSMKSSVLLGMSISLIGIFAEFVYMTIAFPVMSHKTVVTESANAIFINNVFIGMILVLFCQTKRFKSLYQNLLKITDFIDDKKITIFSLFIIVSFNCACWLSYFAAENLLDKYYLTFVGTTFTFFCVALIYNYFKTRNKYYTIYEKYNISLQSIREFEVSLDYYKMNTHENNNHLRTIRNMSTNKKVNSYIDSLLNEKINDDEQLMATVQKIPAGGLRGIIYSKLSLMKRKKIPFDLVVDKKITVDKIHKIGDDVMKDLCSILGVLFDNAIEASLGLEEKYIMIELYEEGNDIAFAITNHYEGFIDVDSISNPGVSTKGDGHGYGLSLVEYLINRNSKISHCQQIIEDNFMQIIKIKV